MKSLSNFPQLSLEHIDSTCPSDNSNSPSKYSLYSMRNRKVSDGSMSSNSPNSPIRLRGLDFSPEKMEPFFLSKKNNAKRKGSMGFELEMYKPEFKHDRHSSNVNEVKLFSSPPKHEKEITPLSKLRIIPDGYSSPQKTKLMGEEQQISPFLKKHHILQETKPYKDSFKEKQLLKDQKQIHLEVNQMTETVDRKNPFYNCKMTESFADPTTSSHAVIKIEESVILQRSVLDSFLILSKTDIKESKYQEMIAIEKHIGLAVSLKSINCEETLEIANEAKILSTIGDNCVHIVKHFTGLVDKNQYIFIREYYDVLLRDMLSVFNEQNIKELCRQMLTTFQFFTSIKLVYKGNFFANVCYHGGLYKLRNFELCSIKKQISESNLKRKYLGVLREMIRVLLGIDAMKPYYSKKLKKDLKPQTIVFMNDLIKNGVGFKQLKEHAYLSI